MKDLWWVAEDQLNDEQKAVIGLSLDGDYLVLGPPGSGKTNLLLLRANYLTLAGQPNILILVFNKSLREFIASGALEYAFPPDKICTQAHWQYDLLKQYGTHLDFSDDFQEQRARGLKHVQDLIARRTLKHVYDAILLDEAQDYLPEEIEVIRALAKHMFAVADPRQKIYSGDDPLSLLQQFLGEPTKLRYHYRNGMTICRFADALAKDTDGYVPLAGTSNYDEVARPSSVDHQRLDDINQQAEAIVKRLDIQLKAYPDELIGIVAPRIHEVRIIWNRILQSPFASQAILQCSGETAAFHANARVCVSTIHAMKGLEARALHVAGIEYLNKFSNQRNLIYTAATRAKTALSLYSSGSVPGYVEKALNALKPPPKLPTVKDAFGKRKT